jgi:DNA-directed RNA polymerase specialized sigma24 family protein
VTEAEEQIDEAQAQHPRTHGRERMTGRRLLLGGCDRWTPVAVAGDGDAYDRPVTSTKAVQPATTGFDALVVTLQRDVWSLCRYLSDSGAADVAAQVTLRDPILDLPLEQRAAFVPTQVFGLSYDEAAQACECPIGTIRSRVARARPELIRTHEPAIDEKVANA